jgi:hypothetical protein
MLREHPSGGLALDCTSSCTGVRYITARCPKSITIGIDLITRCCEEDADRRAADARVPCVLPSMTPRRGPTGALERPKMPGGDLR